MVDNTIALQARAPRMLTYNELVAGRDQNQMRQNAMLMQQQTMQQNQATQAKAARSEAMMRQALARAQSGDIAGAEQEFGLGAGNLDVHKTLTGLRDEEMTKARTRLVAAGAASLAIKQAPDEAARKAVLMQVAPQLQAAGWTDEQLAKFPLDDASLKSAIMNAISPEEALKSHMKESEPYTLTPGSSRFRGGTKIAEQPAITPQGSIKEIMGEDGQPQLVRIVNGVAQPIGLGAPSGGLVGGPRGGDTFSRMIGVESGGQQFARNGGTLTSPKGAVGIAQVMPATAPEAARLAGLAYDENRYRTDPAYNRAIGEAYFSKQLADFGDERLAAAAYNAGPGAVRRALQKGGPDGWVNHVPRETQDYVAKVFGGGAAGAAVRPVTKGSAAKPAAAAEISPEKKMARDAAVQDLYDAIEAANKKGHLVSGSQSYIANRAQEALKGRPYLPGGTAKKISIEDINAAASQLLRLYVEKGTSGTLNTKSEQEMFLRSISGEDATYETRMRTIRNFAKQNGIKLNDYAGAKTAASAGRSKTSTAPPPGVSAEEWQYMTPEERSHWRR